MTTTAIQTPDEQIAEVLGRWTVTDLREMSDTDLDRGLNQYDKTVAEITILERGERSFIRFWNIESNGKKYQVRRFNNFVWCSCKDFFFKKTVCKHLFVTTRDFYRYQRKCADLAPYLKETKEDTRRKKVGSVWI